ncbi:Dolichyl-phosphate-mannose-protein mannosyltransferase [Ensifer adhaerens]|nr:Dolichyl-phosphate-mannose-protein mannosyltransferase [Ensifer adhaerens]
MHRMKYSGNVGKFKNLDIFVLVLIPFIFLFINDNWVFSPLGWLDTWYYVGYGLNYTNPEYLDDYYKISRLPWILLEYFARSNLNSYHAGVALQLTLMCGTILALYGVMIRTLGRVGALFGVLFYSTYTFSYSSGGADYHNSCGGLFFALSWLCAVRAAETNASARWTIATGVMVALSVHSIVVMVNLVPIPVVFFLVQYGKINGRSAPLLKVVFLGILGAIAVTALLCAVNWSVGRNPWFFLLQFKLASSFVADASHQSLWWHDWSTPWYLSMKRLYLLPAASGLLVSVPLAYYIWRNEKNVQRRKVEMIYVINYIFYAILWIFWQTVGQTSLDWVYFAYPLIFPLAGLVGAAAAVNAEELDRKLGLSFVLIVAITVFVIIAPFGFYPHLDFLHTETEFFVAIGVCFVALILFLTLAVGRSRRIFLFVLICSLLMSVVSYSSSRDQLAFFGRGGCHYNAKNLASIVEAHRFFRSLGYPFERVFIWAADQESLQLPDRCEGETIKIELGEFWRSLVSTGFRYVAAPWDAKDLGDIPEARFKEIEEKHSLIVQVSNSLSEVEKLRDRFASLPGAAAPGPIESHQLENRPVTLYYFSVGPGAKQ